MCYTITSMKSTLVVILVAIAVIGVGFLLFKYGNNTPGSNPSLSIAPNSEILSENMKKAGLDQLGSEGSVLHIHQHLDILINNQPQAVPEEIGIGTGFISPIHTHATDGVLHVESPVHKDFHLSQFFDEWGVKFDDSCIAQYCADSSHKLIVAVNGKTITNARDHVLGAHDEIEVWYGDKNENPSLINSFNFPQGE